MPCRVQRTAVELHCFDVRVHLPGRVGCGAGIAPRLVVALGVEEVQREERGVALGAVGLGLEDGVRDLAMEALTGPVRQAGVRDVTDEGVTEDHPPGFVVIEKLLESGEGSVDGNVVGVDRTKRIDAETGPEHCDPSQPGAVVGCQPVDARRDQTFDRARQLRDRRCRRATR